MRSKLILLILSFAGCATAPEHRRGSYCDLVVDGKSLQNHLDSRGNLAFIVDQTAAYGAISAGMAADAGLYLAVFSGATVSGLIICAPIYPLAAAAREGGSAVQCVYRAGKYVYKQIAPSTSMPVTAYATVRAEPFRLRSYDDLAELLMKNAACLAGTGTESDHALAVYQLEFIHSSLWPSLSTSMRDSITVREAGLR